MLQLEGDGGPYRILRSHKNRFGSTQEIGVFEMRGAGMAEVENPSAHLLAERPLGAPGSVVVASADGARPLLVEIQALVAPAAAGLGRRTAAGVEPNRVSLLLAVLAQRAACDVLDRDVFVNVAGGIRLAEPAIDLASRARSPRRPEAARSTRTRSCSARSASRRIRAVTLCEHRLAESARLGFTRALIPAQNAKRLRSADAAGLEIVAGRPPDDGARHALVAKTRSSNRREGGGREGALLGFWPRRRATRIGPRRREVREG